MNLDPPTIRSLQTNTACVRNICILAHVDHGKTTLSDSLIASNGIISKKMAGKVRYLDSRPDEQLRGITMESSAISLFFRSINQRKEISQYLINLIDSPGHIDFSSEVSSVSRLCDGAIVLVDVVEGVCSQTITVLRQAWIDNLKPILVLNKIDRLILELQLTPEDAYDHLQRLIDQTNSIMASFYNGEVIGSHSNWDGEETTWIEHSDADIYFDPNLNNVIFTSAYDGWGFNLNQFAAMLSKKTGFPKEEFDSKLWGDYTIDMKNRKVVPISKKSKSKGKPLFVSFILESIWKIYNSVNDRDTDAIVKITNSLNVKLTPKDLNSKDIKALTQTIMTQFLPISSSILSSIIDKLPSPIAAQSTKIESLLKSIPNSQLINSNLKNDLINCNQDGVQAGYISKMLSIPKAELPENQAAVLSQEEIFERGRIARAKAAKAAELAAKAELQNSQKIEVEVEKEKPSAKDEFEVEFDYEKDDGAADVEDGDNGLGEFENKFEFEFEYEEEEEEDDEEIVESDEVLIAFARMYAGTVKTNDEIAILSPLYDTSKSHDDPSNVPHIHKITIDKLYILMGRDMTTVDIAPAGTIIGISSPDFKNIVLKTGTLISMDIVKQNGAINFAQSLAILDVPPIVRVTLEPTKLKNMNQLLNGIKQLNLADPCVRGYMSEEGEVVLETAGELHLERCIRDLEERFAKVDLTVGKPIVPFRETILESAENVVQLGEYAVTVKVSPWDLWNADSKERELNDDEVELLYSVKYKNILLKKNNVDITALDGYFKSGFSLAVKEGPVINEPLEGVKVTIEKIESTQDSDDGNSSTNLTKFRDEIQSLVLKASPRLKLAMYVVDIQTSAELLGKVYAVIQKQRGQILSEEMKEGTPFFTVEAKLPVLTSFGFSEEIRKKTSGGAIPQLVFDGYTTIEEDPFWVPTTEEEIEELGETGDRENWIRTIMNDVRRNKGLFVDEKVVENAEKQRTLKRD